MTAGIKKPNFELISAIGSELVNLSVLKMPALWDLWDQHFRARPKAPNRRQLESRLMYRLQEIKHGELNPDTRKLLADYGERLSKIKINKNATAALLPGTVLIREFDGRDYQVTVTTDGRFELEGLKYKSLSAVAKHITGTQWSGPVFFGLK